MPHYTALVTLLARGVLIRGGWVQSLDGAEIVWGLEVWVRLSQVARALPAKPNFGQPKRGPDHALNPTGGELARFALSG